MGFYDAFFGSDQSLYTAYAIIAAIIAICVTILFTSTDIPIGSRLLMILFVVITLVPSIFFTLFEITCIVTGGTEPNNWWCYTFGWVLAAFVIIYCIFVVIISIMSLVTYNKAIDNVNNEEEKNKVNPQEANNIAKQIMATQKPVEKFYDNNMMPSFPQALQMPNITDTINEFKKSLNTEGFVDSDNDNEFENPYKSFVETPTIDPQMRNLPTDNNQMAYFANSPAQQHSNDMVAPFANNTATFSNYSGITSNEDSLGGYPDIFNKTA